MQTINHLLVDANGQILATQANTPATVAEPWGSVTGQSTVTCTDADIALALPAVGTPAAYWNGTQVVASPVSPGSSYTWDWPSKTWAFNLTVGQVAAWARIKADRDVALNGTFTWNGHVFDGDQVAQQRIGSAVQLSILSAQLGQVFTVDWTLHDNTTITLNATDLAGVAAALGAQFQTTFAKGQDLRTQIEAATTQAALDAIVW